MFGGLNPDTCTSENAIWIFETFLADPDCDTIVVNSIQFASNLRSHYDRVRDGSDEPQARQRLAGI